jgi:Cu(I)/Ag(I) efflux system membrane protein CusA/SilA
MKSKLLRKSGPLLIGTAFAAGLSLASNVCAEELRIGFVAPTTGIVMLVYLNSAWRLRQASGRPLTTADLEAAITEGALRRLRPKMMTVLTIILGLLPLLIGHGAGSEVLKRIAAPMVGGMVSATLLTLVIVPALFLLLRRRQLTTNS